MSQKWFKNVKGENTHYKKNVLRVKEKKSIKSNQNKNQRSYIPLREKFGAVNEIKWIKKMQSSIISVRTISRLLISKFSTLPAALQRSNPHFISVVCGFPKGIISLTSYLSLLINSSLKIYEQSIELENLVMMLGLHRPTPALML